MPLKRVSRKSLISRLHSTHSIPLTAQAFTIMYNRMTSAFKSPAWMIIIIGLMYVSAHSLLTILCALPLPKLAFWQLAGLHLHRTEK